MPGRFEEIVKHVLAHAIRETRRDDIGDEFLLILGVTRRFGERGCVMEEAPTVRPSFVMVFSAA